MQKLAEGVRNEVRHALNRLTVPSHSMHKECLRDIEYPNWNQRLQV